MLHDLFPRSIDNSYRGRTLALWLFGLVVALKLLQSGMSILDAREIAITADGIALDTYPPAAAQAVEALFALRSVWRLLFCFSCVLALLRYRGAIPLLFAVLLLEYVASSLVLHFHPVRTGSPPGPTINLLAFVVMIVGFGLSLWRRGAQRAEALPGL